jgi:hypothetical protein
VLEAISGAAMTALSGGDRVTFLGKRLPSAYTSREVVIPAGSEREYDPSEWAGALVVVEFGELEVVSVDGTSYRFGDGSVLFLQDVPVATLRNRGAGAALISIVSRRQTS